MNPSELPTRMRNKIELRDTGYLSDCWQWTGAVQSSGYGSIGIGNRRTALVHRLTYTFAIGPIPNGMQIDHLCRNTLCCNPDHLEPVTNKVNSERSARATKTHCVHGHPLAAPNLILKRHPSGHMMRNCRVCTWERQRRLRVKRGAFGRHAVDHRRKAVLAQAEAALNAAAGGAA